MTPGTNVGLPAGGSPDLFAVIARSAGSISGASSAVSSLTKALEVFERLKQLLSDGRCEKLSVRTLRDGRAGMAEKLADHLESQSSVDEVASERPSQGVGAYQ